MKKITFKMNETQLRKVIKESVKKVLKESALKNEGRFLDNFARSQTDNALENCVWLKNIGDSKLYGNVEDLLYHAIYLACINVTEVLQGSGKQMYDDEMFNDEENGWHNRHKEGNPYKPSSYEEED